MDGNSDYVTVAESPNWDILANNSVVYTIDFWVKHNIHDGTDSYITHTFGGVNFWFFQHTHGSGLKFWSYNSTAYVAETDSGGEITDTDWHHIALVIIGNGSKKNIGVYKDGIQD